MRKEFRKLGYLEQNIRFLFSCISEGVIPQGLQFNFTLAKFVNDREIISKIQNIMDDSNSRLLDLIYVRNINDEEEILRRIDALREEIVNEIGADHG